MVLTSEKNHHITHCTSTFLVEGATITFTPTEVWKFLCVNLCTIYHFHTPFTLHMRKSMRRNMAIRNHYSWEPIIYICKWLQINDPWGYAYRFVWLVETWNKGGCRPLWCMDTPKWATYRVLSYLILHFFCIKSVSLACPWHVPDVSLPYPGIISCSHWRVF